MPIDLASPLVAFPSVTYDRCLVAGSEVQENDYNTGAPVPPVLLIYWLKLDKASGAVRDKGTYRTSPAPFAIEKPDGTLSWRANLKARYYKLLMDVGVFPVGPVT